MEGIDHVNLSFVRCVDEYAILAATRCGHTNMYHYFDMLQYCLKRDPDVSPWRIHHNPIVVLRNPLERLISTKKMPLYIYDEYHRTTFLDDHSAPYMNSILSGVNFRIIDFYDLEQYIPRRSDRYQSPRTDSRIDDTMNVEDVYVENEFYTLQDLEREIEIYQDYMVTKERVSVEEWKELTT
jgi:hypothetical protein